MLLIVQCLHTKCSTEKVPVLFHGTNEELVKQDTKLSASKLSYLGIIGVHQFLYLIQVYVAQLIVCQSLDGNLIREIVVKYFL